MKFKQFTQWIRGQFTSKGDESRIPDNSAIQLQNLDLSPSGRIRRRAGYGVFEDLPFVGNAEYYNARNDVFLDLPEEPLTDAFRPISDPPIKGANWDYIVTHAEASRLVVGGTGLNDFYYFDSQWNTMSLSDAYGPISFTPFPGGYTWSIFSDDSSGLKKFYFEKQNSANEYIDAGYFEYYYDETAWTTAFNGNGYAVVIAENGSVYKGSITTGNLVVRWDGEVGNAGGGSSIDDISRVYSGEYVLSASNDNPAQGAGFGSRVQLIHSFIDVGGKRYVFVVSNGKGYLLEQENGQKSWKLLNYNNEIVFKNLSAHIRSISYYDTVFFNDVGENVYMFDAQAYSGGVKLNKHIFFSDQRIFFRDGYSFEADTHSHTITAVNTGTKTFTVSGDYHFHYYAGDTISVTGSTGGNDGDYTVVSSTYSAPNTNVVVSEAISSGVADGSLVSNFRIMIENDSNNYSGKAIYDSLVDIGFIAAGGPIDTGSGEDESDLALGYCLKVGDYFFVLESPKNERGNDYCYIIKFNKRFIAQAYASFECISTASTLPYVMNFDYYNGKFYLMCDDRKLNVFDDELLNEEVTRGSIASITAPYVISGADAQHYYTVQADEYGVSLVANNFSHGDIELEYFSAYVDSDFANGIRKISFTTVRKVDFCASYSHTSGGNYVYLIEQYGPPDRIKRIAYDGTITNISILKTPASIAYDDANNELWIGASNYVVQYDLSGSSETDIYLGTSGYIGTSIYAEENPTYIFVVMLQIGVSAKDNKIFRITRATSAVQEIDTSNVPADVIGRRDFDQIYTDGTTAYVLNRSDDRVWHWPVGDTSIGANDYYELTNISVDQYIVNSGDVYYLAMGDELRKSTGTGSPTTVKTFNESSGTLVTLGKSAFDGIGGGLSVVIDEGGHFVYKEVSYTGTITKSFDLGISGDNYVLTTGWASFQCLIKTSNMDTICMYDGSSVYWMGVDISPIETSANIYTVDYDSMKVKDSLIFVINKAEFLSMSPLQTLDGILYGSFQSDSASSVNIKFDRSILSLNTFDPISDGSTSFDSDISLIVRNSQSEYVVRRYSNQSSYYVDYLRGFSGSGLGIIENCFELFDAGSNMVFTQIDDTYDLATFKNDFLSALGAPARLSVSFEDDATSTMTNGTKFKYYMSFKFYDGDYTQLSVASGVMEIPNVAGAGAQPLKVVITGCNLKNDRGEFIYETDDIEEIYIYRSKKTTDDWSVPTYLNKLEKDSSDEWYVGGAAHTYALETVEDNAQTLVVNPFAPSSVRKYPCRDIVVHKNRLILVNRTDEVNSNVLNFSGVDVAQAIPPENIRDIQSGDGDQLYGAVSIGDYLYLFKEHHTYAILGDVETGQLVDVDLTIGTKYTFSIVRYRNSIFFMNEDGIFQLTGTQIQDISYFRYDDFFNQIQLWGDPDNEVLDFENMADNVYGFVDTKAREIMWCVPQKVGGNDQSTNNIIIIYNINLGTLRSYSYNDPAFIIESVKDVSTGVTKTIFTDYSGQLYEIGAYNDDNGSDITYSFTTKAFNLGSDIVHKSFRLLKFFGKNLDDVTVSYEIDGTETSDAEKVVRSFGDKDEVMVTVTSNGIDNSIKVTVSGTANEDDPVEINEILLGYQPLRGIGN